MWPTQIPEPLKPFSTRRREITVEAGCLLWGVRVIIPAPLQSQLLKELHHGHPGISKMKATARHHMWWPHLDQDIEKLVKNCQVCKAVKPGPPTAPLHPWSWPAKRVHIDFAGPIHGKSFLLAVDSHSKWQMAQTTATHTLQDTVVHNSWSPTMDHNFVRKNFKRLPEKTEFVTHFVPRTTPLQLEAWNVSCRHSSDLCRQVQKTATLLTTVLPTSS